MESVLVVGTGLIGTSIGLALHGRREVLLADLDEHRLQQAVGRGAGAVWDGSQAVSCAVVAVPPLRVAGVLQELQESKGATTVPPVASTQSRVQADLEVLGADLADICGGHPLAGRETSGPAGASADLFLGRPWVTCPYPGTTAATHGAVRSLAADCGADALDLTPEHHDRAVALSSHLPQVAASALAAQLVDGDTAASRVAGPGLQDSTRIAASDAGLWEEVLATNAEHVAPLVASLAAELTAVAGALAVLAGAPRDEDALATVRDALERGRAGRALVPVKRGVLDRDVAVVAVRVPDEPGRLADLLVRAAAAGVNVEDVRVEHLTGRPTGVVELLVRAAARDGLRSALSREGLEVLPAT